MKINSIIRTAKVFSMVWCMFVCSMCKKESDPAPVGQAQRLVEHKIFLSDTQAWRSIYSYSGELLSEIIDYDSAGMEWGKVVFGYDGNTITSFTRFEKSSGGWFKRSYAETNSYSGGNTEEVITYYYDQTGAEYERYKNVYIYEGLLLKKVEDYNFMGSSWQLARFESYNYDGQGRIVQVTDTSAYYYGTVTTFTYDAVHMTESLQRDFSEGILTNDSKSVYHYADNLLAGTTDYLWNSTTWTEDGGTQFEYNAAGNLVRERIQGSGFYSILRVDFAYGEGNGNYRQCMKATGSNVFPGDPFPYPVKSLQPGFLRKTLTGWNMGAR